MIKVLSAGYRHRRKAVHVLVGILIVSAYALIPKGIFKIAAVLVLSLAVGLSIIVKYLNPWIIAAPLKHFDKPSDFKRFPGKGAVYYLMGVVSAILIFDRTIASASILILAFGDPAAHFIGKYYGKRKLLVNKKKVLEGTLAGIFAGAVGASFFVPLHIAMIGAGAGMIAEAIELEFLNIDDNFFIPLVAGIFMQGALLII